MCRNKGVKNYEKGEIMNKRKYLDTAFIGNKPTTFKQTSVTTTNMWKPLIHSNDYVQIIEV